MTVPPRTRRLVAVGLGALLVLGLGLVMWNWSFLLRLSQDRRFLKLTLRKWGALAPVIFVAIQALQVIVAPIPGELTGFLGGYLFGERLGFVYSSLGLTLGSLFAFGVGRWLGAPVVHRLVPRAMEGRMSFVVKAEGVILCAVVFLIPGLPKDIACYLFGLSPIPLGVFAIVSTLGRMPGTWALSAQGAKTATGQYRELIVFSLLVVAALLPLYWYRERILGRFRRVEVSESEG